MRDTPVRFGVWAYREENVTNFEFYKNDSEKLIEMSGRIAIVKGKLLDCQKLIGCSECQLTLTNDSGASSCETKFLKWLYEEHVKKPILTKQEKAFLELLNARYYIARDKNNFLFLFEEKPIKEKETSRWIDGGSNVILTPLFNYMTNENESLFAFISWEDEKPWNVKDLLELEVVE